MDTPPAFTLSLALDAWRRSLPALPPDDLAELESHLLDSMAELQKAGLSEPEAFLIARRRLGSPADLAEDFYAAPAAASPLPTGANGAAGRTKKSARQYRSTFINAGLLALLGALAIPIGLLLTPKKYAASVMMEIMRTSTLLEFGPFKGSTKPNEPSISNEEFLATQLEIVTAKEPLMLVAKKRGLTERWRLSSLDETFDHLKKMVKARLETGTNLIRIAVLSGDKKEAAEIADDVAEAYIVRRKMLEAGSVDLVLGQLTQSRKGQQQVVERAQNKMGDLAQQLNISDPGPEGPPYTGPAGDSKVDSARYYAGYNQAKADYQQQLKILREMIDGQENARLTNLMPRRPAVIHEHATEPVTWSVPNSRPWLTVAALIGVLGALSLLVGLLCRPLHIGRSHESALQAEA